VLAAVMLLDTLPTPSTDGVDKVYQQLKDIIGTTDGQQAESSLQRRAEVSISTLTIPRPDGKRPPRGPPR
jgi:hypothetical protein